MKNILELLEQPRSLQELAKLLQQDPNFIHLQLCTLQEKGYIQRIVQKNSVSSPCSLCSYRSGCQQSTCPDGKLWVIKTFEL